VEKMKTDAPTLEGLSNHGISSIEIFFNVNYNHNFEIINIVKLPA
jgi:hypothetical protein